MIFFFLSKGQNVHYSESWSNDRKQKKHDITWKFIGYRGYNSTFKLIALYFTKQLSGWVCTHVLR